MSNDVAFNTGEDQHPTLDKLLASDWHRVHTVWIVTGVFVVIDVAVVLFHVMRHLRHPRLKLTKLSVRIMLLNPLFAVTAYLSVFFFREAVLFELLRACYEALVLHWFLSLILYLMGGTRHALHMMAQSVPTKWLLAGPPLGCCFYPLCPARRMSAPILVNIRRGVLFYAWFRPLQSLLSLAFAIQQYTGSFNSRGLEIANNLIYIFGQVAMLVAFYLLLMLYRASRPYLKQQRMGAKFSVVKLGLILATTQRLIVNLLVNRGVVTDNELMTAHYRAEFIQNALLVIEAGLMAYIVVRAFPLDEKPLVPIRLPSTRSKSTRQGQPSGAQSGGSQATSRASTVVEVSPGPNDLESSLMPHNINPEYYSDSGTSPTSQAANSSDVAMSLVEVFAGEDDDEFYEAIEQANAPTSPAYSSTSDVRLS